jgi:phospholipid/cholesterol/gamma-HCH transport system ATP-binding protein
MELIETYRDRLQAAELEPPPPVISVDGLCTHYGRRQILFDVDFEVSPGEIMVIMGGSGSGKSTLLRHLIGIDQATSGAIHLLGQDITKLRSRDFQTLRRKIGVAFQGGALFSSMSVEENVKLPLRELTSLDGNTTDIMARLKLELVNLAGFGGLMPSELSGGMLKRAAVARAIVMDPALLFFDEPSAGLDPVVSSALDDLIRMLRESMNMTIVVVTHELTSAFQIADRITVLDQGRVLAVDTVDGIRNSNIERIQNLLNRRAEVPRSDPDEYLRRLTGEAEAEAGVQP